MCMPNLPILPPVRFQLSVAKLPFEYNARDKGIQKPIIRAVRSRGLAIFEPTIGSDMDLRLPTNI